MSAPQSLEVTGTPTGGVDSPHAAAASPKPEQKSVKSTTGAVSKAAKAASGHKEHHKYKIPLASPDANLGVHIANRLVEIGCTTCFAVPGDFNLLLLDQLLKQPELNMVWCCNELNAGYAADGYARKRGVGCVCVTFCVGGFSAINAVVGAYSEDLPLIVISGGPNSQDHAANRILHHTTGLNEYGQQLRAFRECTCCQVVIQHIEDAHMLLDTAISEAMLRRKPVYIEVACNLADLTHPSFARPPVPYALAVSHTNQASLEAAVEASLEWLGRAVKPVLLQGVRTRPSRTRKAMLDLANSSRYPVAVMPDAKGFFPEDHPQFIGMYWGPVSSPCVCEVVESSDVVICVGGVWTDYSTTGYSLLLKPEKMIRVDGNRVTIGHGPTFGCIVMADFLEALAARVKPNDTGHVIFKRMVLPTTEPPPQQPGEMLRTNVLFKHIQHMLTPTTSLISEVGDSWFNTLKLKLPPGAEYELQMRYGSIGWSVGAVLGYSCAEKQTNPERRVVACIGDGSFQMTAQGPYNVIKNWDYTGLVRAFHNGQGKLWTAEDPGPVPLRILRFIHKARTETELEAAISEAVRRRGELCFIMAVTHRDDCSKELLEWGSRVAAANSRKPGAAQAGSGH
ncbi:hypothetical protein VOLCADRAFT_105183 [Volvox carteri f. nagariensis]|uniref:pyruvate decarboxylase n=1 Tax=Volvox carteri f. nagariensis TaxID=3068 RepID=D8TZ32_VOLCA|nr:uncharacterized protein VOLCADRAFT_105183 [Volvox carteri f. nagariensis]EFJ47109.1 hypothetical protein VOLCADRAFT_105183 [Volvox carteri f. nagariensis]|eukprot:XP_002951658.1 hypothetical protein VOLCADRAFT_105183 [Volvox carteri f. nagariensis]